MIGIGVVCLTAVIRCRPDTVDVVEKALVAVGDFVVSHEPGTLDYRVIRVDGEAPTLITQERFRDRAALESHNEGAGSKAFFAATAGLLGDVTVLVGNEISSAQGTLL